MSTTTTVPPGLVTGAPRTVWPYGLLSVVGFRGDGDRWSSGVEWETDNFSDAGGIGEASCDPETPTQGLPKTLDGHEHDEGAATPFTVYGHFSCSPVGYSPASAQARADDHLAAKGPARVEQAFWTGDLGNVPNLEAEATDLSATPVSMATGVALLESHVVTTYGGVGVIHVPIVGAVQLVAAGLVKITDGRLTTALGTPVVAGAGYPTPGDGTFVARVSPPVFGYRSEVFTSSNRSGDLLDRGKNDLYAVSEQTYLLGFDPVGVGSVVIDPAI